MKRLYFFVLIVAVFLLISGCAGKKKVNDPPPQIGKSVSIDEVPYSISKIDAVSNIVEKSSHIIDDASRKFARNYAENMLEEYEDQIVLDGIVSCKEKVNFLKKIIYKNINRSPFSTYKYTFNFAINNHIRSRKLYAKYGGSESEYDYVRSISEIEWWQHNTNVSATGVASVDYAVTGGCLSGPGSSSFNVSIRDYVAKNAKFSFQNVADIAIDWDKVREIVNRLNSQYVVQDNHTYFNEKEDNIAANISRKLGSRFSISGRETITFSEKEYRVDHSIALSRLQRNLDDFKFEESKSRFDFTDTYCPEGYSVCSNMTITVNTFPEEGGRTVVKNAISFDVMEDTLLPQPAFGPDDARRILSKFAAKAEKVISAR